MKYRGWMIVTFLVVLALAACTATPVPETVVQPTATATVVAPTETETPIPTETLKPTETPTYDAVQGSGFIGFENFKIARPEDCTSPNPDGFYYIQLYAIEANKKPARLLKEYTSVENVLSWSPNGRWVLFLASDNPISALHSLFLLNAQQGEVSNIVIFDPWTTGLDIGSYNREYVDPVWTQKGDRAAISVFSWEKAGGTQNDIYLFDLDTRKMSPFISTSAQESALSWSPDGACLAYIEWEGIEESLQSRLMVNCDGSEAVEVLCCGDFTHDFHWSSDSRSLIFPAFNGEKLHITEVPINEKESFTDTQLPASLTSLVPSPNHRQYALTLEIEGQKDIFIINISNDKIINLTNHPAQDESPIWSPDGKSILFTSNRGDKPQLQQLYIVNTNGSELQFLDEYCLGHFTWVGEKEQ